MNSQPTGMKMQSGVAMGRELCHMLGLDPSKVNEITLHAPTNSYAWVAVKVYVNPNDLQEVEMRRFTLVEFPEDVKTARHGLERTSSPSTKSVSNEVTTDNTFMTVDEVCDLLQISKSLAYTQIRKHGKIIGVPALKIGTVYRFNAAAIRKAIGNPK